jgi:glyoxylase-like metal-dependent hydrolase (beta-lactamase superfamily II)
LLGLGPTHDLFGDGVLRLVPLPGHARGQVGLYAETVRGPVLFAADGCWWSQSYRDNRPPHHLPMHLFFDDAAKTLETLRLLHSFSKAHPNVWIVPTHCPEIAALLQPGMPEEFF